MTGCGWQFHGVGRRENGDGTVTLTLEGWRYTSNAERDPGDTATCRWCRQPIHRDGPVGWQAAMPGDCPDAGPLIPHHSPEPLPEAAHAASPCVTRTVPVQFVTWDGERRQVVESDVAGAMVAEHVGDPWTVVWQGQGWTVEIRSGHPLWQMTG